MRRPLQIATTLVLTAASSVYAQASAWRIGVTTGVNASKVTSDFPWQRRFAMTAGGLVAIRFRGNVSIQPEMSYSVKGATLTDFSNGRIFVPAGTASVGFESKYIEMPILLRYDLLASRPAAPFVYVGPALGYNVACKVVVSGHDSTNRPDCAQTGWGAASRLESSGVIGGGLSLRLNGTTMSAAARYTRGFTAFSKSGPARNRVMSGLVSVEIPLAKN